MNEYLQTFVAAISFAAGVFVGMLAIIGALIMFRYSKKNES